MNDTSPSPENALAKFYRRLITGTEEILPAQWDGARSFSIKETRYLHRISNSIATAKSNEIRDLIGDKGKGRTRT